MRRSCALHRDVGGPRGVAALADPERPSAGTGTPGAPPGHGASPEKVNDSLTTRSPSAYKVHVCPTVRMGASMPGTDKRKQSLYFPEDMLNEIQAEANRQDRSLSWIVQQAWRIARGEIMRFPSVNDVLSGVAREDEREEKGG